MRNFLSCFILRQERSIDGNYLLVKVFIAMALSHVEVLDSLVRSILREGKTGLGYHTMLAAYHWENVAVRRLLLMAAATSKVETAKWVVLTLVLLLSLVIHLSSSANLGIFVVLKNFDVAVWNRTEVAATWNIMAELGIFGSLVSFLHRKHSFKVLLRSAKHCLDLSGQRPFPWPLLRLNLWRFCGLEWQIVLLTGVAHMPRCFSVLELHCLLIVEKLFSDSL